MGKSKTQLSESSVNFLLDGVDLHSLSSQEFEDFLVSEPNIEFFKID